MRSCHALTLVAGFVVAATVGACGGGKPSADDCKKFADHYVAKLSEDGGADPEATKKVAEGMRPKLVADCEKSDKASIDCILNAKTMAEIEKCDSAEPSK
jgi:small lipoprotein (TIGR04454 family)